MRSENIIFTLPTSCLWVCANRYTPYRHTETEGGLSLVFAHWTSAHKELWEPMIAEMFDLQASQAPHRETRRICEAWSLDAQSHGDSALLNKDVLEHLEALSIEEYASMLRYFITSDYVRGRDIAVVGQSASTSAWILACSEIDLPRLRAIILIEPVMITPPIANLAKDPRVLVGDANYVRVSTRQDAWPTYAALEAWLRKTRPWKTWEPRMLALYLAYGFTTARGAVTGARVITPKCPRAHELGFYPGRAHVESGRLTAAVCARYPVHAVFGERPEMVSLESRRSICDASQGRQMASITLIPNVGHSTVQESPDGAAKAVYGILMSSSTTRTAFDGSDVASRL
ncbi:hypothetical protein C8Q78DRAFT_1131012 [Trametes maxima]|nr:hypothetical protein C8Q78DRAFT_1131012 [Trametes maxima]